MSGETAEARQRLWDAVDDLTRPTHRRTSRDDVPVEELADVWLIAGSHCKVDAYRALQSVYGTIPPLWQQANLAVFGSEAGDGSGGSSPLRERSPADLDLMETLLTIRESLGWQLPGRGVAWRRPGDIPDMMRQFASHIATNEPQHLAWWAYRFEQWGRLLRNHLNAVEQGPRDRYIRNTGCPRCGVRQVVIERDGERRVVPAIVVDFVGGWIRAAACQACGHAWFRGDQLGDLAAELDDTPNRVARPAV